MENQKAIKQDISKAFKKSTKRKSSGTLTTSFEGTHGWYWKNTTSSAVDVILKINGEYQRIDLLKKQKAVPEQKDNNKQHESIF